MCPLRGSSFSSNTHWKQGINDLDGDSAFSNRSYLGTQTLELLLICLKHISASCTTLPRVLQTLFDNIYQRAIIPLPLHRLDFRIEPDTLFRWLHVNKCSLVSNNYCRVIDLLRTINIMKCHLMFVRIGAVLVFLLVIWRNLWISIQRLDHYSGHLTEATTLQELG